MTLLRRAAATVALAVSAATMPAPGAAAAPANSSGPTTVPFKQDFRSCDFTRLGNVPITGSGQAIAFVRSTGSTATAQVQMFYGQPDTHYDVVLIEAPRPSAATCGPGDPGTAVAALNTDGAGAGTVTVQSGIRPGTTGVWLTIERPNEHSQAPIEFYSSDFIAPV